MQEMIWQGIPEAMYDGLSGLLAFGCVVLTICAVYFLWRGKR